MFVVLIAQRTVPVFSLSPKGIRSRGCLIFVIIVQRKNLASILISRAKFNRKILDEGVHQKCLYSALWQVLFSRYEGSRVTLTCLRDVLEAMYDWSVLAGLIPRKAGFRVG